MAEFEKRQRYSQEYDYLSEKDNFEAIRAYNKSGWTVLEEHERTYVMSKTIA
jgi:hypothetical protein